MPARLDERSFLPLSNQSLLRLRSITTACLSDIFLMYSMLLLMKERLSRIRMTASR